MRYATPLTLLTGLAALALAFPPSAPARAADALSDYAVVSLIGDRFTVADHDTDARREGHRGYAVTLGGAAVDGSALAAVEQGLEAKVPGASVKLILVRDPAVYEAEEEVLGVTRETQALVDALQPILSRIKARRLVLVSKIREPADVHFADAYRERPGVLEGLGFYLDPGMRVQDPVTLERAVGYLGAFAHIRVSVIDQQSRRVLDEERIAVVEALRDPRKDPWEGMTAEQKVKVIKSLVAAQVARALPVLLDRVR